MPGIKSLNRSTPERITIMFAKQAQIAVAAIALTIAGGAFAQSTERNVFDTETNLRMPAAVSAEGLTREAVQAQYIAKRDVNNIASFNPESHYFAQNNDSTNAIAALFNRKPTSQASLSREEVRAQVAAERNVFDTETDLRVPSIKAQVATTVAQR
jgi:SLT domain-containing protein